MWLTTWQSYIGLTRKGLTPLIGISAGDEELEHREAVRTRVEAAKRSGARELNEVLRLCEGADPALVSSLFAPGSGVSDRPLPTRILMPEAMTPLSPRLPAPDPSRSQWWFSSSGISDLLKAIEPRIELFPNCRILCLGTPTLAPYLSRMTDNVEVLDVDNDVLNAVSAVNGNIRVRAYDAAEEIPTDLLGSFNIVITDPPWYSAALRTFLNRGIAALVPHGELFCTLPGRLTRPGVEKFRSELIRDLVQAHHDVLSTRAGCVQYQVPRFELSALKDVAGFSNIPWRSADLIHIKTGNNTPIDSEDFRSFRSRVFTRNPAEFRIFVGEIERAEGVTVKDLPAYSRNVSTRAHPDQEADVWSTEKVGIQTDSVEYVSAVLEAWSTGRKIEDARKVLKEKGCSDDFASDVTSRMEAAFQLWAKFAAPPPLRVSEELEEAREASLSDYAQRITAREHNEPTDPFRGEFQRDRDRVLWSAGLRRLTNKTQLFPVEYNDDLRQRLTHSIEVSQLASTVGTSFGLDNDLIEAGALAHDIGHTPFGHAGEFALDRLLLSIGQGLTGFNHYEHGLDVLRYLEGPYYVSPSVQFTGLNLTSEVCECVFKHTYCHNGSRVSAEELLAVSKHGGFVQPGYSHLEGQAVRLADKIAYLISDIEDGIRLGAVSQADLLRCRFFHRPPLNFHSLGSGRLYDRFIEQRRWVLKILMEDVLQASNKRLVRLSGFSREKVRNAGEYMINHSDEMSHEVDQIWHELQAGRLHKDSKVRSANLRAARVVSELAITFTLLPELIDEKFRDEHARLHNKPYLEFYRKTAHKMIELRSEMVSFLPLHLLIGTNHRPGEKVEAKIEHLIMAKDYVAALSDSRARQLHRDLTEGRSS